MKHCNNAVSRKKLVFPSPNKTKYMKILAKFIFMTTCNSQNNYVTTKIILLQ